VNLVPGFIVLLQAMAPTMTTPAFESLVTVVTGWVFSGRGTITRSILSAGDLATKHFSSYHRRIAWSDIRPRPRQLRQRAACLEEAHGAAGHEQGFSARVLQFLRVVFRAETGL
jgi:hypothetical protein